MKTTNQKQWPMVIKTVVLAMAGAGLVSLPYMAHANPTGGQVVAGDVSISQESASKIGITQTTAKGIIDWQKFSIGANEQVQYYQPSASSITLNRVVGQDPSQILGRLTANGQIVLVNPNGIYFGKNAQVDVAGLVATTHNIRNEDFLAGHYNFNIPGNPGASVINEGTIRIADTGIAAFVAPSAANRGVIVARLGKVAMASANGFTLDFHGDQLLSFLVADDVAQTAFDIDGKQLTSFVENSGRIEAQGGYVLLTAKAAESAIHGVINQSGVIEATTVGLSKGEIILDAGKGSLEVSGTLDASSPNGGDGGFIETSGAKLKIADGTLVTTASAAGQTGMWLIDPTDFTIYASGGDLPPTSGIAASTLNAMLGITNATIVTSGTGTENGDIYVNSPVNWSANELTLSAHGNININADLNATNTASLALIFGQGALAEGNTSNIITKGAAVNLPAGTNNFTTKQGSDGAIKNYTVITSLGAEGSTSTSDLQGMNGDLTKNYVLGRNIDASATAAWNAGAGFAPIGTLDNFGSHAYHPFFGIFDGLGHTISNLNINRPTEFLVGLFGYAQGASFRNVGLIGGNVTGDNATGGLAGSLHLSNVSNSYFTGNVTSRIQAGGLVGSTNGSINNSYATGNVNSSINSGGLVGFTFGSINNSYATGNVNGSHNSGGLVGSAINSINNSYATGNVNGGHQSGGLVGHIQGSINNSYAIGSVNGGSFSGGLGGSTNGNINNSHATGNVNGGDYVGGLAGHAIGSINNSYATGSLSGYRFVGGLVGYASDNINNSFAIGQVSGDSSVGGLVGIIFHYSISNSYATGNISGNSAVGGLVGSVGTMPGVSLSYSASISDSYATGHVIGQSDVGGLAGLISPISVINNSYYDTQSTGQSGSPAGTGQSTAQMKQQSTYTITNPGWDFVNTWVFLQGDNYPTLRDNPEPIIVTPPVTQPDTPPVTPPVTQPDTPPVTPPVTQPDTPPVTPPVTTPTHANNVAPVKITSVVYPSTASDVFKSFIGTEKVKGKFGSDTLNATDINSIVTNSINEETGSVKINPSEQGWPSDWKNLPANTKESIVIGSKSLSTLAAPGSPRLLDTALALRQAVDNIDTTTSSITDGINPALSIGSINVKEYLESIIKANILTSAYNNAQEFKLQSIHEKFPADKQEMLELAGGDYLYLAGETTREINDRKLITLGFWESFRESRLQMWDLAKATPSIAKLEARFLLAPAMVAFDAVKTAAEVIDATERAMFLPTIAINIGELGTSLFDYFKSSASEEEKLRAIIEMSDKVSSIAEVLKTNEDGMIKGFGIAAESASAIANIVDIKREIEAVTVIGKIDNAILGSKEKSALIGYLADSTASNLMDTFISLGKVFGSLIPGLSTRVDIVSDVKGVLDFANNTRNLEGHLSRVQKNSDILSEDVSKAINYAAWGLMQYGEAAGKLDVNVYLSAISSSFDR